MEIIKKSSLKKHLKDEIGEAQNPKEALERFISFTEKYKMKKVITREDEDMLLFQYGTYNWTGKGANFELNLTRQFEISNDDEFLQLRLTLFYKPETVGEIESNNAWSIDFKNHKEWTDYIKSTIGFKKVDEIKPDKIKIDLQRT